MKCLSLSWCSSVFCITLSARNAIYKLHVTRLRLVFFFLVCTTFRSASNNARRNIGIRVLWFYYRNFKCYVNDNKIYKMSLYSTKMLASIFEVLFKTTELSRVSRVSFSNSRHETRICSGNTADARLEERTAIRRFHYRQHFRENDEREKLKSHGISFSHQVPLFSRLLRRDVPDSISTISLLLAAIHVNPDTLAYSVIFACLKY